MSTNNHYLAVFLGSKTSPKRKAWDAMPEGERQSKEKQGIAAWKTWVEKYQSAIVNEGGPLGKTKRVSKEGILDVTNELAVFIVVSARLLMKPPQKYSKGTLTSQFFPGKA